MSENTEQVRERFIEQMGLISQGDGLPRIAGRLMGLMIFDGTASSFSELAVELQVSRGSISTNARMLEQMGIIERVSKPGDRQDYFQLANEPYANILKGALARSKKARESIADSNKALPKRGNVEVKLRLEELEQFYDTVVDTLSAATGAD